MSIRRMTYLMFGHQACLLIVLSLAVLGSSGCLTGKVAEASRRKAQEIIAQAPADKKPTPAEDVSPDNSGNMNDSTPHPIEESKREAQDNKQPDSPRPVKENRLYIDGSKSMAGFAGQGGDFDKFFGEIGYVLGDPIVYKFGSPTKNLAPAYADLIKPTTLGQAQKSPQFYDLYNNPDDVLFTELNDRGTEALSVYVSDGVYSASDARAGSKVITPLADWFSGGRVLGIFVLSAPFNGSFYSEKLCSESRGQQCWLQKVNVPKRPFYAFVFSPNEDAFRRLQRELKSKFTGMKTLVFADGALTSEGLSLPEDESLYDSGKQSEGYYWQMFSSQLFTMQSLAELSFSLTYAVDKEYPLGSISPRISAKYYLWDNDKGEFIDSDLPPSFKSIIGEKRPDETASRPLDSPQAEPGRRLALPGVHSPMLMSLSGQVSSTDKASPQANPGPARSNKTPGPKSRPTPDSKPTQSPAAPSSTVPVVDVNDAQHTGFQLRIPRDARGLYGFYYLQIGIEVDALSPDIQNLSTDDDSDPLHANQTYRFAEVIKALLEAHLRGRLATQIAPPLFLTIGN